MLVYNHVLKLITNYETGDVNYKKSLISSMLDFINHLNSAAQFSVVCVEAKLVCYSHYENIPMQYTASFTAVKNDKFQLKKFVIFLIFAHSIDRRC